MSSIPDEVYLEILLRLPVKSTFICKCVCKSWLSIISNPNFVKSHLNLAIQNNKNNTHLMFTGMIFCDEDINTISHDSLLSSSLNPDEELIESPFLSYPYETFCFQFNPLNFFSVMLSGSSNGLVCLWCTDDIKDLYCFWNPATREYKETPAQLLSELSDDYNSAIGIIGFGYDSVSDDYRFVEGRRAMRENYNTVVRVYSLRSDEWEPIPTVALPYSFTHSRYLGVFFKGAFHWLGKTRDENLPELIISMDINNVQVRELQLPREPWVKKHPFMNLGELEECICVLVDVDNIRFEVWVMQEYGVWESWVKSYVVNYVTIASWPKKDVRLMISFKSGEILFGICGHDPIFYNPENGSVRELSMAGLQSIYEEVNYFESLVTLNSGTRLEGTWGEEA